MKCEMQVTTGGHRKILHKTDIMIDPAVVSIAKINTP